LNADKFTNEIFMDKQANFLEGTSTDIRQDRHHVLVCDDLPPSLSEYLRRDFHVHEYPTQAYIQPLIQGIVVGGRSVLKKSRMDEFPSLKAISVMGAGYDGVDVAEALRRNLLITHTPAVHVDDVADFAMAMTLTLGRQLIRAHQYVKGGRWVARVQPHGASMSGAKLGIVGMGQVGQAIAQRANAFKMGVGYHTRTPRSEAPYKKFASVRQLALFSDFLVLAASGGHNTKHIVGPEELAALGPQGFLINVGRGSLVDQEALTDALSEGRIAGAALDVFEGEPHVPARLRALDNVILTPHIASATHETSAAMQAMACQNLSDCLRQGFSPHFIPELQEFSGEMSLGSHYRAG
jgi:hydroxypyruvate reductase